MNLTELTWVHRGVFTGGGGGMGGVTGGWGGRGPGGGGGGGGGAGGPGPPSPPPTPTSISEPNKVQQLHFQKSWILLFTGIQKLYGQEISRLLLCMLQFMDNLRLLFIFSNYIREIDHFTLDLLKTSDT